MREASVALSNIYQFGDRGGIEPPTQGFSTLHFIDRY